MSPSPDSPSRSGSLRIHLEPVGGIGAPLAEVGQLQRARHRSRPLLTGCGSFEHGLAVAEPGPDGVRLRCRNAATAHQAAVLARRALGALAPLRELLDDQPADRVLVDGASVQIASAFAPYLVHRLLASAKALPSGPAAATAADKVEFVEYDGPDAIAEFDRGGLQATAPTSFEIAQARAADPCFRPYELDVFALLLVDPRRPDRHAIVRGRRLLRQRLAAEPELSGPCAVMADDTEAAPDRAPRAAAGGEAELLYADFWPNAAIARALGTALAELGTRVRPRPAALDELRSRTAAGSFDLALVLSSGYAGPHLSMPLTLTRAALVGGVRDARLREAFTAALAGPEDGPGWHALTGCALRVAPAIPLCRMRGGSLVDPALPEHPLAYGCVLPLEHYAGGCSA